MFGGYLAIDDLDGPRNRDLHRDARAWQLNELQLRQSFHVHWSPVEERQGAVPEKLAKEKLRI